MDNLAWIARTQDPFVLAMTLIFGVAFSLLVFNIDYIFLIVRRVAVALFYGGDPFKLQPFGSLPAGLIVIPSLLRNDDDYDGIVGTVHSCATNEYPNELIIIVSVDGKNDNPTLYQKLISWLENYPCPKGIHIHHTYNEVRKSKMMAIETGVQYMHRLVLEGKFPSFPPIYFSVDADGTLSENALERMATKLTAKHFLTGNPRKVVAGNPMVPYSEVWKGWRNFFSVSGQNNINIARQFLLANLHRANLSPIPFIALPGAIYCTWTDVLKKAPYITGYLQIIKFSHWIKWWFGIPLPKIDEVNAPPLPEALTGSTDDTSIAIVSSLAWWKNGKLEFDAPRSPIHAFCRMLREWFVDRSHGHDMYARAYTFVPPTVRGLWLQRTRWNSSRVEAASRFTKAFLFWWESGSAFLMTLAKILATIIYTLCIYFIIPLLLLGKNNHVLYTMLFAFSFNTICTMVYCFAAFLITPNSRAYWSILIASPIAWIYSIIFEFGPAVYGMGKDIFLFGCNVKFCPEQTLISGKSERIAILYRVRRFLSMCVRSAIRGDVPFGKWWFGWHANKPYVKSGYDGWSSGKNANYNLK